MPYLGHPCLRGASWSFGFQVARLFVQLRPHFGFGHLDPDWRLHSSLHLVHPGQRCRPLPPHFEMVRFAELHQRLLGPQRLMPGFARPMAAHLAVLRWTRRSKQAPERWRHLVAEHRRFVGSEN